MNAPPVSARLLRGFASVGTIAAAVKVVSLGKELLVASTYGRAGELDAFLLALVLPTTVAGIVGGAFHQAAVPLYAAWLARDERANADLALRRAFGAGVLLATAAGALLALLARPLLGSFAPGRPPGLPPSPGRYRRAVGRRYYSHSARADHQREL